MIYADSDVAREKKEENFPEMDEAFGAAILFGQQTPKSLTPKEAVGLERQRGKEDHGRKIDSWAIALTVICAVLLTAVYMGERVLEVFYAGGTPTSWEAAQSYTDILRYVLASLVGFLFASTRKRG